MDPIVQRTVSSGKFTPIYIFFGEDTFNIHQAKDDLSFGITNVFQGADINKYDSKEDSIQEILMGVSTVSMFSATRIVVVDNFQDYSSKDQVDFIETILQTHPKTGEGFVPENTFVIVMHEAKSFPVKKLDAKLVTSIEFKKKYERDAIRFVNEKFKDNNLKIEGLAAELLVEYLGTDFQTLSTEIEKVITYVGEGSLMVTVKDIEKATSKVSIENVFDLCDHIAYGRKDEAIAVLRSLIYYGEAIQVLQSLLASHMRALCIARDLIEDRKPENLMYDELSKISKSSFRVKKFIEQARCVSKEGLKNAIFRLTEVDFRIKKGQMAPDLAMELAVLDMADNIKK